MRPAPHNLGESRLFDIREQQFQVALVPLGTCEPHNYHLPYATDALHAGAVANRIAARANEKGAKAIVLPTIPFGVQTNMKSVPLAINLYPSTLSLVLHDIVESLSWSGIRKILFVNGHGGNDFLKPFIREEMGKGNAFLCSVDWWRVGKDVMEEIFEVPDDHAGELETSVMLHLFPQMVEMSVAAEGATKPAQFEAVNAGWVSVSRPWHLLTQSTGAGDPRAGTATKGERYIEVVVERLAVFVNQLSAAILDEFFPFAPS